MKNNIFLLTAGGFCVAGQPNHPQRDGGQSSKYPIDFCLFKDYIVIMVSIGTTP
jgi:hypothetical protein